MKTDIRKKINIKKYAYLLSAFMLSLAFTYSSCEDEKLVEVPTGGVQGGIIKLYTSNGGETWEGHVIWPFVDAIAYDISSDGPGMLRIAGQIRSEKNLTGLILSSTDAGDTWRREAQSTQFGVLNSVFSTFYTTVAGENSTIAITSNGGVSWVNGTLNSSDLNIKSVAYNNEGTIGIAVGDCMLGVNDTSFIYRSTDLGQTWIKTSTRLFYTDYRNFNDVVFTSYTEAIAVSDWGAFMRTSNGGQTWNISQAAEVNAPLNRISLPENSSTGFAVGENGRIVRTQNEGVQWADMESATQTDLLDVVFINQNLAFAVGQGIILKSTNNGSSWTQKTVPNDFRNNTLRAVYFYDNNHGYIVGGD